ncbi:MAG TPA: choice-of-anchor Q domain-containing protein [Polyangiaceae bacterium]|nr:choice-of-anchor Q domain-containing protein [Polyangiaceae bacterium]
MVQRRFTLPRTVPAVLFGLALATPAAARDFYVDPVAGADSGDGGQGAPWKTLATVLSAGHVGTDVKAGDTVFLLSGYHGKITFSGGTYSPPITVTKASGATPTVSSVGFAATHGWVVRGLSVSPTYAPSPSVGDLVTMGKDTSDVLFEDSELFSVRDSSAWTADQWINEASSGISVRGDHETVRNNVLTNVRFGIAVDGPNALVDHNRIENFSADGLRGLGDYDVFQYNLVKNVYVDDTAGDSNHDDGFQSWSVGPGGVGTGVVTGVVLRGNYILNREDPNQKLTNSLQGIGCFDGYFDQWVVENNVVITDHWHGISFYGMKNSRIVNNTVIDVNDVTPGPPWIMVTAHKDGTPSENCLVRNNLATDYDVSGTNVTNDHNTTLKTADLVDYFLNPGTFDLHLLPTAPAIDQGTTDQAPSIDADGIPRPQGAAVDLGAYEWHEDSVGPVDGGSGIGGAGSGGGSNAAGGAASTGGSTGSGGGASSSGGGNAGGAASGTGGGSSTAGASGSGNPGSGGATGASNPDGGPPAPAASKDDSGCGCAVAGGDTSVPRGVLLAFVAALLVRHRAGARRRARRAVSAG